MCAFCEGDASTHSSSLLNISASTRVEVWPSNTEATAILLGQHRFADQGLSVIQWPEAWPIYLHRDPVDFRKSINGLSVIVEEGMNLSPFDPALFVFCNRSRDKLKVLYWDNTGFVLWYKRLEKDKFKWPRKQPLDILSLNPEQWDWLLRGLNFLDIKPHQAYEFTGVN